VDEVLATVLASREAATGQHPGIPGDRPEHGPAGYRSSRLGGEREREILRVAYELLGEVGYAGLRFDAVAARARTSKATLYRHWPGKAQLVADAVRACKRWPYELPDTGSLRGDLIAFIGMTARHMSGEDGPLLAGVLMAMRCDPELAAEMRAVASEKPEVGAQICGRAVDRGQLAGGCRAGLIEEIAPALLFMRGIVRGEPIDDGYVEHLVDDIILPLLTG
jgi:AcrR family transcriptional regulator